MSELVLVCGFMRVVASSESVGASDALGSKPWISSISSTVNHTWFPFGLIPSAGRLSKSCCAPVTPQGTSCQIPTTRLWPSHRGRLDHDDKGIFTYHVLSFIGQDECIH